MRSGSGSPDASHGGMESSSRRAESSGSSSSFEIKPVSESSGSSSSSFHISEVKPSATPAGTDNSFRIESAGASASTTSTEGVTSGGSSARREVRTFSETPATKTAEVATVTETPSTTEVPAPATGRRGISAFTGRTEATPPAESTKPRTEVSPHEATTPVSETEHPAHRGISAFTGRTEVTPRTEFKPTASELISEVRKPPEITKKPLSETHSVLLRPAETVEPPAEKPETTGSDAALEAKREAALQEIALREYPPETLAQVEHECRSETFRDGTGREITKAEAVDSMLGDLNDTLDSLRDSGRPLTDDQRRAILEDAKKTLYSQEAESQSRGIGSHGVSHIHGVYERMRGVPDDVLEKAAANVRERHPESTATASDMRAALLVAAMYHDEGYLAEQARKSPGRDGMHGVDSAIAFEHKHAPLLEGTIDPAVLEEARQAIAEHNVLEGSAEDTLRKSGVEGESPARREVLARIDTSRPADMDPNRNFVRSALLLSDKAAVDADEKFPDVLRDEDRARVMLHHYQQQETALPAEDRARLETQVSGKSPEEAADAIRAAEKSLLAERSAARSEEMKKNLSDMVRSDASLSEGKKARYLAAIGDLNPGAGSFDLPMAGMTTPRDALRYHVSDKGEIEATLNPAHRLDDPIYVATFGDRTGPGVPQPPEGKKARGMLADLGVTAGDGVSASDLLERKDADTVIVRTDDVPGLRHVTVEITRVNPETMKGDVNETVTALEAQAEQEREIEASQQIRQEAISTFREQTGKGEVSLDEIITLCGAVYEGNEAQVQQITDAIAAHPDMTPAEVSRLADMALAMCDAPDPAAEVFQAAEAAEAAEALTEEEYKARIDRTPVNHGKWVGEDGSAGVRGESKFVPESPAVREALAERGVDGIEYREGVPDLSPVTRFDAYLEPEDYELSDYEQFSMCTLSLQEAVIPDPDTGRIENPALVAQFTEDQLIDIENGITPEGYTWHHDVEAGHMQLVPTSVHQACRHAGGRSIWGGGAKARTARKGSDAE